MRVTLFLALGILASSALFCVAPEAASARDAKSAKINSGNHRVIWFSGSNHVRQSVRALHAGDAARAVRMAAEALEMPLRPGDKERTMNVLCVGSVATDELLKAIQYCDRLIALGSRNWRYYNNRANAFLANGMLDEAIADYRAAISLATAADEVASDEQTVKLHHDDINPTATGGRTAETGLMQVASILEQNLHLALRRKALGMDGVIPSREGGDRSPARIRFKPKS